MLVSGVWIPTAKFPFTTAAPEKFGPSARVRALASPLSIQRQQ